MMHVGVLGGGPWGVALARAARRARATTTLVSRRHQDGELGGIRVTSDYGALAEARLVLLAVPSDRARAIARALGDHLGGQHLLVHGIRGLGGDELATMSQILRDETPARRIGALGGPVQADELSDGRPSALVVASEFVDVTAAVEQGLSSKWLQVHASADLRGLEWASALMDCLSIGLGYVQARSEVSPGLLAALISRAVGEAANIAAAAGAQRETFFGLGGYGDLLASLALPERPGVVLGRELAAGASLEQARQRARHRVEGVELIARVVSFARRLSIGCGVFEALDTIIGGGADPEQMVAALFAG